MRARHLAILLTAAATAFPTTAPGQGRATTRGTLPVVKVAKWTLLAAAVGLGAYALRRSDDAADAYDALRAMCLDAPVRCYHEGRAYADAEAEALYDRALAADRQAQRGIYGGQAALLGSVALFILDLRSATNPPTIPYPVGAEAAARRFTLVTIEF